MSGERHVSPGVHLNTLVDSFVAGINYPWVNCDWDFGARHPWNSDNNAKWQQVTTRLNHLCDLGLQVVRFWILGDGLIYPGGEHDACYYSADRLDQNGQLAPNRPLLPDGILDAHFRDDFGRLLQACQSSGMTLIPCLTSFGWFLPLQVIRHNPSRNRDEWTDFPRDQTLTYELTRNGRANFVVGDRLDEFIECTLNPILEWSREFQDQIFAFDVINEPDWIVDGPISLRDSDQVVADMRQWLSGYPHTFPAASLWTFLERCIETITTDRPGSPGFPASIGCVQADMPWLGDALQGRAFSYLNGLGLRRKYIHQLHYYPPATHVSWPPRSPVQPCMMGEFSAGSPVFHSSDSDNSAEVEARHNGPHVWPDPDAAPFQLEERERNRYLYRRLQVIDHSHLFPVALIWSATDHPGSCRSRWGPVQEDQVDRYLHHRNPIGISPPPSLRGRCRDLTRKDTRENMIHNWRRAPGSVQPRGTGCSRPKGHFH